MQQPNTQSALPKGYNLNHYKIIKVLGQGGFGITYLALDKASNKPVVIKEYFPRNLSMRIESQVEVGFLSSAYENDFNDGLRRFRREAETLSQFQHPNIVKVLTYFEMNSTAYFVMEQIEGSSLHDFQRRKKRALNESEIIHDVLPALEGLRAVHAKGMLHLDLKLDNILQTKYGAPILIDFGGAKVVSFQNSHHISDFSSMVATPGFAPLEQMAQSSKKTPATDLYAFGMTLYALMAPNEKLPECIARQTQIFEGLDDPLKNIRHVALGFNECLYNAVEKCTRLNQKERPQSVDELQLILKALYENESEQDIVQFNSPSSQAYRHNVSKENSTPSTSSQIPHPHSSTSKPMKKCMTIAFVVITLIVFIGILGFLQHEKHVVRLQNLENEKLLAEVAQLNAERQQKETEYRLAEEQQKVIEVRKETERKKIEIEQLESKKTHEKKTDIASNKLCLYSGARDLNYRSTPGEGSILGQLALGEKVCVMEERSLKSSVWYKIQSGKQIGWVHASYLLKNFANLTAGLQEKDNPILRRRIADYNRRFSNDKAISCLYSGAKDLNYRTSPSKGSILGQFELKDEVCILETKQIKNTTWYKVQSDQRIGWVHSAYLVIDPEDLTSGLQEGNTSDNRILKRRIEDYNRKH